MKTSITNAIAAEAKANMDALMAKGQGMNFQVLCSLRAGRGGPEGKALIRAWANEGDIMDAAKRVERCIERAKRDLDEALGYVQTNQARCLNPCGILQSTNQELDRAVAELRLRLEDRKWYAELLG